MSCRVLLDGVDITLTDEGLKQKGEGELYIGGQGLGQGYLHLEELTQGFPTLNQKRLCYRRPICVDQKGEITIKVELDRW